MRAASAVYFFRLHVIVIMNYVLFIIVSMNLLRRLYCDGRTRIVLSIVVPMILIKL